MLLYTFLFLLARYVRAHSPTRGIGFCAIWVELELELELIQSHMTQKPVLRGGSGYTTRAGPLTLTAIATPHQLFEPRGKGLAPQLCAPLSKAKWRLAHPHAGERHKKKAGLPSDHTSRAYRTGLPTSFMSLLARYARAHTPTRSTGFCVTKDFRQ